MVSKGSLAVWLNIEVEHRIPKRLPAEIEWSKGELCRLRVYYAGIGGIDNYIADFPIGRLSSRSTPLSRCFEGSMGIEELL